MKAICDWGESKKDNKVKNQILASESAVSFLKYVFSKPEAFKKLPVKKNKESESLNDNIIDISKKNSSNNNESINMYNNQVENMFVAQNATINGGINFGRKN